MLDYVLRDMTAPEGRFYSAEDADSPRPDRPSEKAEGAFYVWEQQEIIDALGTETAALFNAHYGVKPGGNVENDPHHEFQNKNILIVRQTIEESAAQVQRPPDEVRAQLAEARARLFALREQRPRPHLDDKVLTAWNGLMISAFARAYQVLDDPRYLDAAQQAASFIKDRLYNKSTGQLLRRYRDGEAMINEFLDDYAYLIQGLIDLYEADFEVDHLTWAETLQKTQDLLFGDPSGGYFSTDGSDPNVLLRMKDAYDGAEPSANSVATLNLLRLSQMLDQTEFREKAEQTLSAFSGPLQQVPYAMPQMLIALEFHLDKPKQIIIAGQPDASDTKALLRAVHDRFLPNRIILLADGGAGQAALATQLDFIKSLTRIDDQATAYICEDYTCQLPTSDPVEMIRLLEAKP